MDDTAHRAVAHDPLNSALTGHGWLVHQWFSVVAIENRKTRPPEHRPRGFGVPCRSPYPVQDRTRPRSALAPASGGDRLGRMSVEPHEIRVETEGHNQVLNITNQVASIVEASPLSDGIVTVFVVGSTAGVTTTEFEPGLVERDLKAAFEGIAPENGTYLHEQTWHDDNGHSHVRASLLGPSVTIPFIRRQLQLGTWQQIVLIDFDTQPRSRKVVVQLVGE